MTFHTGDNAGFQTINACFGDGDTILVVLTNDQRADLTGITMPLVAGLLGHAGASR